MNQESFQPVHAIIPVNKFWSVSMTINPTAFNPYSLDVAPELRRRALSRTPAAADKLFEKPQTAQISEISSRQTEFVHSVAFVEEIQVPEPQRTAKGIPIVQRLHLSW